jgi:short-subunit dehydrogenase
MQTILILGATSPIGAAICEQFANDNRIILSGRNQARLNAIAVKCQKLGAVDVIIVAADLAQSIQSIIDVNSEWPVTLIIDAASASSRSRDPDVAHDEIQNIIQADVLSHLEIYRQLATLNKFHPNVVFISTILSIVQTPGREIYSAAKRLIEIYLEKLRAAEPDVRVLIFRVGKLIDPKQDNFKAKVMAERVSRELSAGNVHVLYGMGGRILMIFNSLHPVVLKSFVNFQRLFRDKSG